MINQLLRQGSKTLGIISLILGIIVLVLFSFLDFINHPVTTELVNLMLGLLALGMSCIALDISFKSDDKMKSIALQQFDEKLSVLMRYVPLTSSPFESYYYDLRSTLRLANWVDDEAKIEFKKQFNEIIRFAEDSGNLVLVKSLKQLEREFKIDAWI